MKDKNLLQGCAGKFHIRTGDHWSCGFEGRCAHQIDVPFGNSYVKINRYDFDCKECPVKDQCGK